jgi:acyl carrier protein
MDVNDYKKVRDFIKSLLFKRDDADGLTDAESLFLSGRLDSLAQVELVVFLEQEFGLDFTDVDFEQIDSINAIEILFAETNSTSA